MAHLPPATAPHNVKRPELTQKRASKNQDIEAKSVSNIPVTADTTKLNSQTVTSGTGSDTKDVSEQVWKFKRRTMPLALNET